MRLSELANDIDGCEFRPGSASAPGGGTHVRIAGLTADSGEVHQGYIFAAIPGTAQDGADFIPAALGQGAAAILVTPKVAVNVQSNVPLLISANPRATLAELAHRFYDHQPDVVCAVTGTNGKTSVANFLHQIWASEGKLSASLGTLGVVTNAKTQVLAHTTPDPVTLHRHLHELALGGISHAVIEASSHGLAQHRLDGVNVAAGALTNLTRDHLDYHESFEEYLAAKLRLFSAVVQTRGAAVLNADMDYFDDARSAAEVRRLSISSVGQAGATLKLISQMAHGRGLSLEVVYDGHTYDVELPLMGGFQASNVLIAAGLALATGSDASKVFGSLGQLKGAEGRVELIGRSIKGGLIFVDYAHTPNALESVLKSIRLHTERKLHVVFGCGGDRDQGKRPLMGKIAADHADITIVTDDNPRFEDADAIRAEIMAAAPKATEIGDRAAAIAHAMAGLESGDALIVAGKGHESGQSIKGKTTAFKDADVVRDILAKEAGA